jgi:tetratricopeptide (TPR) repeat protein
VTRHHLAAVLATAGILVFAASAHARNPHCAGGIQYVVQGMRDKDRGNMEDYQRQMSKAIQQLEMCASEDGQDFEAIGYLGWAYAEVDSMKPAGKAFEIAIAGLQTKSDKKKVEWATTNRESYWATNFNKGIEAINAAQAAYPNYTQEPQSEADKSLRAEAGKKYSEAEAFLQKALALKPTDARTLRNLGAVHAFMGQWEAAEKYFNDGLKVSPDDADLKAAAASIRQSKAGGLVDAGKYDEAIAYYGALTQSDTKNPDLFLGLAEAHFKKAQAMQGDARKPEFKLAGDSYAKAGLLKTDNADLPFNAALAYQNASEYALAEAQWRRAIALRPEDNDAKSALGSTLAELKKYDEAAQVLHAAVVSDPKNKALHRQLGSVYTKAGMNVKGTEELMVFLALQNGTAAPDAAARAKEAPAGSDAAKMLASMGPPDQVNRWEADGSNYDTWFYWEKRQAMHFAADGRQAQKSDWSSPALKSTAGKK